MYLQPLVPKISWLDMCYQGCALSVAASRMPARHRSLLAGLARSSNLYVRN